MQEVTYIKHAAGPRGGEYWVLTLACGHVVVRPKPKFRIWKMFEPVERFLAPERVKCIVCDKP